MPQMAPLNWTLIFMFSLMILMICTTKIFFTGNPPKLDAELPLVVEQSSNPFSWKW